MPSRLQNRFIRTQHYVHDRANGCQCNSRSWWQKPYYFAIRGRSKAPQKEGAFNSCGLRELQAGSVKLSSKEDDVSAAYTTAVPDPIRGRGKYLGSTCNSCDSAAGRVGPSTVDDRSQPQFRAHSHDLRSWPVRIRVEHSPERINVRTVALGFAVRGQRPRALR